MMVYRLKCGSETKHIKSENVKKIELACSFGELKVYFDQTIVTEGEVSVYVEGFCAGIEFYVPTSWNVRKGNVKSMLGDIMDEQIREKNDTGRTLVISGDLRLCAVKIVYV